MAEQLLFTSASRGLEPGASGYCVVEQSEGINRTLSKALQRLSSYDGLHEPRPHPSNPIAYSHLVVSAGRQSAHVLSRICDYEKDFTGRTNFLAHHVVPDESELLAGGPAAILQTRKDRKPVMQALWGGQPQEAPPIQLLPFDIAPGRCTNWEAVGLDAGWGGVLAGQFDAEPRKPTYVRIPGNWSKTPPGVAPDQVTLALIGDALALLNHRQRWGVTFSTYYSDMLAASGCSWRFVIDGSPAAATWPPHNANFIDLVDLDENKLRDHGKFVAIARGEDIPQPGPSPGPVPTTITAPAPPTAAASPPPPPAPVPDAAIPFATDAAAEPDVPPVPVPPAPALPPPVAADVADDRETVDDDWDYELSQPVTRSEGAVSEVDAGARPTLAAATEETWHANKPSSNKLIIGGGVAAGLLAIGFCVLIVVKINDFAPQSPVIAGKSPAVPDDGDLVPFHPGNGGSFKQRPPGNPSVEPFPPGEFGEMPKGTESKGTESKGTESKGTESKGTEPKGTEPKGTESKGTEPKGTEPKGGIKAAKVEKVKQYKCTINFNLEPKKPIVLKEIRPNAPPLDDVTKVDLVLTGAQTKQFTRISGPHRVTISNPDDPPDEYLKIRIKKNGRGKPQLQIIPGKNQLKSAVINELWWTVLKLTRSTNPKTVYITFSPQQPTPPVGARLEDLKRRDFLPRSSPILSRLPMDMENLVLVVDEFRRTNGTAISGIDKSPNEAAKPKTWSLKYDNKEFGILSLRATSDTRTSGQGPVQLRFRSNSARTNSAQKNRDKVKKGIVTRGLNLDKEKRAALNHFVSTFGNNKKPDFGSEKQGYRQLVYLRGASGLPEKMNLKQSVSRSYYALKDMKNEGLKRGVQPDILLVNAVGSFLMGAKMPSGLPDQKWHDALNQLVENIDVSLKADANKKTKKGGSAPQVDGPPTPKTTYVYGVIVFRHFDGQNEIDIPFVRLGKNK